MPRVTRGGNPRLGLREERRHAALPGARNKEWPCFSRFRNVLPCKQSILRPRFHGEPKIRERENSCSSSRNLIHLQNPITVWCTSAVFETPLSLGLRYKSGLCLYYSKIKYWPMQTHQT